MSMISPSRSGFLPSSAARAGIDASVCEDARDGLETVFARAVRRQLIAAARVPPEERRNFRRLNFLMMPNCKLDVEALPDAASSPGWVVMNQIGRNARTIAAEFLDATVCFADRATPPSHLPRKAISLAKLAIPRSSTLPLLPHHRPKSATFQGIATPRRLTVVEISEPAAKIARKLRFLLLCSS